LAATRRSLSDVSLRRRFCRWNGKELHELGGRVTYVQRHAGTRNDWRVLLDHVHRRLRPWLEARGDTLAIVDPATSLDEFWLREDLLLSQTCGYPLVKALAGRVQLVATPVFSVDGCAGGDYWSILVARTAPGVTSLAACADCARRSTTPTRIAV